MSKRNKREEKRERARELTRKEIRLHERDRERNRKLYLGVGAAIGLAFIILIAGALYAFVYIPNSQLASVAGETIVTKDFWQRMRLQRSQLISQLVNMQQLQQQFGSDFFASQISQLNAQLDSPFALGFEVLDTMIDEKIIAQEAAARGITVSEEEVDAALREEIARNRNAVTVPQATETAEAGIAATATATLWTPTPTPTIDASLAVTATATTVPTPEPLPTRAVLSDTGYTEGINELSDSLDSLNSVDLAGYREIIRNRLLREKLSEVITAETVSATEEQVHARHILIRVMTPTLEIDSTNTITAPIGVTGDLTGTTAVTGTDTLTEGAVVSDTEPLTTTGDAASAEVGGAEEAGTDAGAETTAVTTTEALSATATVTDAQAITATAPLTGSAMLTGTTALTDSVESLPTPPEPVERTDAEARALAEELRQRLLAGEDFATLAREYSDDTGSGAEGGDLGWFGRGAMVPSFEEAAFSLEIGEISQPIKSQFGYHIIEVLEKDENHPKDEATLEQERNKAFSDWLTEKKTTVEIERPVDLNARLPLDLR